MEARQLQFAVGNFEPFFCCAAVYDAVRRERVSETWSFETNEDIALSLLGGHATRTAATGARRALFALPATSSELFLLVTVHKVLRAVEVDAAVDPYYKVPLKAKEKDKLLKEAGQTFPRLAPYRQPFAWGAVQLFSEASKPLVGKGTAVKLLRARADDTALSLLDALRKGKDRDKKPLPCEFLLDFSLLAADAPPPPGLLDPALRPVADSATSSDVVREMESFVDSGFSPRLEVVNHLYVYPESVNLTKHKDSNNRHLAVTVALKDTDEDPDAPPLRLVYGGACEAELAARAVSPVTFKRKAAVWSHEVKLRLPAALSPRHHLVFDFGHVNCEKAAKAAGPVETPLGFVALPLLAEGRPLEDGRLLLPVAASKLPTYLSPEAQANCRWVDNKKPLFSLRTRLVSSVLAQDAHLHEFFLQLEAGADSFHLEQACKHLRQAPREELAAAFFLLLPFLLEVVAIREKAGAEAFASLLCVCSAVAAVPGQATRSPALDAWMQQHAGAPTGPTPLFQALARRWADLLDARLPDMPRSLEFAWLLFGLIAKALALHLHDAGRLSGQERGGSITAEQAAELERLVCLVGAAAEQTQPQRLATEAALFVRVLLAVADRDVGLRLAHRLLAALPRGSGPLAAARVTALRVLCAAPAYTPLCLPAHTAFTSVATLHADFWRRHFLPGLLLDELAAACTGPAQARHEAIAAVREVLERHEADPALADPALQRAVAGMYFPLLLTAIGNAVTVQAAEVEERREWAACLLYVVARSDADLLLRRWWRADTQKNHLVLLQLLAMAVDAFEEEHAVAEASLAALDVLELFLEDFAAELASEGSRLMEAAFALVGRMLQARQAVPFLSCLFMSLRRLVWRFAEVLFGHHNTAPCSLLCYQLLRLTNSVNAVTRSEAGSLFYLMVKTNFAQRGNFSRMKMQATIAVSRLCGEARGFEALQRTLEYVALLAQREFKGQALGAEVEDLTRRLFKVIHDSAKISQYAFDPETTADLTHEVSVGYVDSPDLRVAWLENLAKFHREQKNLEEVAQCKFAVAALVVACLNLAGPRLGVPASARELQAVFPNVAAEPGLPSLEATGDERLFNSAIFSEEGLEQTLSAAVKFLKMGERYETCIDVYNTLLEVYQSHRDYQKLASSFRDLKSVCDVLVASNQAHSRLFNLYYRVAFYGAGFGHLAGKEYVYKEHNFARLSDFSERLKSQFSKDGVAPKVLPNGPVDEAKLDADGMALQIVTVEPYFDASDSSNRTTAWDRNFNIKYFIFETPFTTTGKAHGDLSIQCKRKTILEVEKSFPYLRKRLQVVGQRQIVLQPIENAIEIIESRKNALRCELELNPPNLKTLQINLQGAVLAQVNAGPSEIARTFLGGNAAAFPADHVASLVNAVQEFKNVCGFEIGRAHV